MFKTLRAYCLTDDFRDIEFTRDSVLKFCGYQYSSIVKCFHAVSEAKKDIMFQACRGQSVLIRSLICYLANDYTFSLKVDFSINLDYQFNDTAL